MANNDKDSTSEVESEAPEEDNTEKEEIEPPEGLTLGKKELMQQVDTLKETIKKKEQIISVLEKENEVLKTDIKKKEEKVAELKESVLNLELMLNKAQRAARKEETKAKKEKPLDFFIPK